MVSRANRGPTKVEVLPWRCDRVFMHLFACRYILYLICTVPSRIAIFIVQEGSADLVYFNTYSIRLTV